MNLERDFAAWADRRDAVALARVFDGTAGRLLLLAVHLAGTGATAEDLVQSTFLSAMARASTWDRQRPVWPWLAAILHNEARMHWRGLRRRREVDLDAATDATTTTPDPAQLAASDEAFAAVVRTIDALPLPYRQVLRLRLVHGLQPIEIARALEVPAETVRSQLHRGLQQLREALPAGVAVAAAMLFTRDGALLAQVRARVFAKAATLSAAAATPASLLLAGGWWTMHGKTVGFITAGAALLLCLGYLFDVPSSLRSGESSTVQPTPLTVDLGTEVARPDTKPPETMQRSAANVATRPTWPLVVTVTTRAGKPIANASVRVWVASRGVMIENQEQGNGLREEVADGPTGTDGSFGCALDAYRAHSALFRGTRFVFVTATLSGAGSQQHVLALPRTTEPREFAAQFELAHCAGITGRVVDGSGMPVAAARLHTASPGSERLEPSHERSGDDGRFCIPAPDELEQWPERIVAVDPQHGTAIATVPRPETMPAAGATLDVGTLVLDGRDAIRGQVLLGDGSALGHFRLFVAEIDPQLAADPVALQRSFGRRLGSRGHSPVLRNGHPVQLVSRPDTLADGSFRCSGLDPDAVYAVAVRDSCLRYSLVVARPGEAVRLLVERQLLLLDVRSETGEALQGLHLMAEGFDPDGKHPSWPATRRASPARPGFPAVGLAVRNPPFSADAEGRLMLLSPFDWIWRIGVSDEIAQPDFVRHEAIAGVYRTERSLVFRAETRFGTLHLRVVDENDDPLSNYGAYLRCLDRDLSRDDSRMIPPDGGMKWELPAGRWNLKVLLGKEVIYAPSLEAYARGSAEQEVVIEDARTTEVKIEAKPAGLVGFRVHSDLPPAGGQWEELVIHSEPGGGIEVPFLAFGDGQPFAYVPMSSYGLLFIASQSFAPGRHTFLIAAKGYRTARCEVDIAADELTRVEVEMFRQQ